MSKHDTRTPATSPRKCPNCAEGWQHPSAERPGRLVCNICGTYDDALRSIYVWLVPSEQVLEQPGSWRIRKWDTLPFIEANYTLAASVSETKRIKEHRCPACGYLDRPESL
jgi:ssDNA-binding Zn-finger/Zn-ribbon topoisomerase 1